MVWMIGIFLVGLTVLLVLLLAGLGWEARRGQEESDRMERDLCGLLVLALTLVAAGCVSPHQEGPGVYIKTAHTEFRSLFGTNNSFAKLERCDGPTRAVLFYLEGDFANCRDLTPEEEWRWHHGYSQGQGGQIVNAGATLGGFAWLAQAQQGASIVNSAAASTGNQVLNIRGHYGRR